MVIHNYQALQVMLEFIELTLICCIGIWALDKLWTLIFKSGESESNAYAHLIGGFFYALNDIYTQGGIYNNHINNRTANNLFQT